MQPRVSQRSRFIAKSLLVLIAALILVGMAYEQIAKRVDRKKFGPPLGKRGHKRKTSTHCCMPAACLLRT